MLGGNRLKGKFLGSSYYRSRYLTCLATPPGPAPIGGGSLEFSKGKWLYQNCRIHTPALSKSKPIGKQFSGRKKWFIERKGKFFKIIEVTIVPALSFEKMSFGWKTFKSFCIVDLGKIDFEWGEFSGNF